MSGANPEAGVATGPAKEVTGGPEGGLEGRAPEGTAGPSPAAGEAATRTVTATKKLFRYKMPYRYTGMGGLDYAIAICQTCRRTVERVGGRRSRTGNHGEDYFEHEHPLSFIVLVRSNAGNRRHYFAGAEITDEAIKAAVDMAIEEWEWYGVRHTEVKYHLKQVLNNLPGGEKP
jgi:hypothetical protein